MLNGASTYSIPCNKVKIVANSIVNNSAIIACFFARTIIAWCAQVTVAPELKRKNVLVKGIPDVWIVCIASGGHTPPKLKTGDKLEWKKAQKKAKKNMISETINKIIPNLKPRCTEIVCCSSNVASLIMSRHQVYITYNNRKNPINASWLPPKNLFIYKTAPEVIKNAPKEANNGQGLGSTKCQLCFVFRYLKRILLFIFYAGFWNEESKVLSIE